MIILITLYRAGKGESVKAAGGWGFILLGFSLIFFGTLIDITDNFPSLDRYVIIGNTEAEAFLEKVVGYLFGFVFLAAGFIKCIPSLRRLDRAESDLGRSREELEMRLKAEEEARKAEARLEHLLLSSPAVIYSCRASGDFGSTFVSDNIRALTGYAPEDCLANPDFWREGLHPEDAPRVMEGLKELFDQGHIKHEYRFRRRDGSYIWIYDELRIVRGADGEPLEMVGYWIDITGRKQAEDAIMKREKFLSDILDSVQDGLSILDRDLNIVRVNSTMERWYPHQSPLAGKKCYAAYHGSDTACDPCPSLRTLKEKKAALEVVPYRTQEGQKGWLELFTFPLIEEGSEEPTGVIEFVRDITLRWEAEEQIKKSLKEKEVLLQEVHHRVKNNMAIIISLLNIQSRRLESPQCRDALMDSQNRIRAMALVHDNLYKVKDFSRISFRQYVMNLAAYLVDAYTGGKMKPELDFRIADETLDPDKIISCGLILNELLTNSIKHAFSDSERPEISIGLEIEDARATLTYADNGCGLAEDISPQKAESFGLQIIDLLTKQLDGEVMLQRDGGTRFTITFPLEDA